LGGGYIDLNDEDKNENDGENDSGNDGGNEGGNNSRNGSGNNSDDSDDGDDSRNNSGDDSNECNDSGDDDENGYLNNNGFNINNKPHIFPSFPMDDINNIPTIFRHRCITDAAHKFFTNGKLLVTCCYFEILKRWQPILLSWIGRDTTKTCEYHFFNLFIIIAEQLKVQDERSSLLTLFQKAVASVVDYSDAQCSGFQAAYARFMTTTQKGLEYQFSYWKYEGTYIFESY
jgi:hypothetical protein